MYCTFSRQETMAATAESGTLRRILRGNISETKNKNHKTNREAHKQLDNVGKIVAVFVLIFISICIYDIMSMKC